MKKIKLLFSGLMIGFINALFGAGGGILIVLILTLMLKTEKKKAHATAVMAVLVYSVSSILLVELSEFVIKSKDFKLFSSKFLIESIKFLLSLYSSDGLDNEYVCLENDDDKYSNNEAVIA